jgi:hypothetical protein
MLALNPLKKEIDKFLSPPERKESLIPEKYNERIINGWTSKAEITVS